MNFYKEARNIYWKKDDTFNVWLWSNWMSEERNKNRSISITHYNSSKWIKDHKIKQDTMKLIEEKVRNSLEKSGTKEEFLNTAMLAQALKSTINK